MTVVVYQPVRIQGAARFLIACSECNAGFPVAQRTLNEYRRGVRAPLCRECKLNRARPIRVTEEMRRFWLDRFTVDEIRLMGEALEFYAPQMLMVRAAA